MPTDNRWTETIASSLDRHFPWGSDCEASLEASRLRSKYRESMQEVDDQIVVNGSGKDNLEWRVTSAILQTLFKRTKRLPRNRQANCLYAFSPQSDSFVWAVYRSNSTVREAVSIWCHHMGWQHVYVTFTGGLNSDAETSREGIHLINLRPNSVMNRLKAINTDGQPPDRRTSPVQVNTQCKQRYNTNN